MINLPWDQTSQVAPAKSQDSAGTTGPGLTPAPRQACKGAEMIDPLGYAKLWRRLKDHPIWSSSKHHAKILFVHLLITVNWKAGVWVHEGRSIPVLPGQRITTLGKLSQETGLTIKSIRLGFNSLRQYQIAAQVGARRYTTVTLLNWARWQEDEPEEGTTSGTKRARLGHDRGTSGARIKEGYQDSSTSTPSVSSGKPPEETSAGFALESPSDNSVKPKRVAKPEKPKRVRLSDGWPGWKKAAFKTLISEDPKKRYCAGSDELFDRRVMTEVEADWLIRVHREQIAECRDFEHWEGFYKWLKSAITLMDAEISAVSASKSAQHDDHIPGEVWN